MKIYSLVRNFSMLLAVFTVAGMLISCQKKAGEEILEKAIEQSTGKNAEIDVDGQNVTIETEGKKVEIQAKGASWPDEIPKDVPLFPYGKIKGVTRTETPEGLSWGVVVDQVPDNIVRNYEEKLKSNGFQTSSMLMSTEDGQGGSITGEKDNISIVLMTGNGNASISVNLKK
jgi:hypothetical protein